MTTFGVTRRRLLARLGLGAGGMALIGAGVACAPDSAADRREAAKRANEAARAAAAPKPAVAGATATTHASHSPASGAGATAAQGISADAIDKHHEDGIKAFPAKTEGLGGQPLAYTMDGDTNVFRLNCGKVRWEVRPGEFKDAFAYSGTLPGPEIRVTEGEKVRFVVTNNLPGSTSVHWHGLITPNAMDGVPFITQPPIKPGAPFTYEFVAKPAGSHMYHSHHKWSRTQSASPAGCAPSRPSAA
jgi:FtsP/CotA-like multicopper oxidase with cupredoxin domain